MMVLPMVVTVIYGPVVLLLPGVQVNPAEIARSLVILMLIPLAIGRFVNTHYDAISYSLQPQMAQASSTSLLVVFVLILVRAE